MNTKARLIVFEGVDAAGKTAICHKFIKTLTAKGIAATLLSFPGKIQGTIGELVYRIHHEHQQYGVERLTASSLQALHIAAHLDAIETLILPRLQSGESIVLDRFWWSTLAYGVAGGADANVLNALIEAERLAWGKWQPSALFFVTRRTPLREEPMDNWMRYKDAYQAILERERGRYPIHVIENEGSLDASVAKIIQLCAL